MDERHLHVVDTDAAAPGEPVVDLTGSEPLIDVSPEENPWTAASGRDRRLTHPSLQDGAPRHRPDRQPLRPTTGRDDRIRAYLRLVEGS